MPDPAPWYQTTVEVLKRHDVRLVTYVPDNVLRPLIEAVHADPFFTPFVATREEEALGIVAGAWMARLARHPADADLGLRDVAERDRLARGAVPDPGADDGLRTRHLGRVQPWPGAGGATMRPVLDALAIEHHTMTRADEVDFILDRSIRQAVATRAPACFILSPLLTGGKVFAA